jgi:pimeloyl-ACP methyl ester carboxylesterase
MSAIAPHRGMPRRIDVGSSDGTSIAMWVEGEGSPIVLVHGSLSDHTSLDPLRDELRSVATTFSIDRRGFGASGDQSDYAIEREFEDVAAVMEAVVEQTGQRGALFGHSYGANCAMGGAALSDHVSHVVLYEPSLGLRYPPGSIDSIQQHVDAGDMEAAIVTVLTDVLEMTEGEVDGMKASASPPWETRVAMAPTVPRECRVEDEWIYEPGQFDSVRAPVWLLTGSESNHALREATEKAAASLPNARIVVLEGQAHVAHRADPRLVAGLVTQFMRS